MALFLSPEDLVSFLPVPEVVRRARGEFRQVFLELEEARRRIDAGIAYSEQLAKGEGPFDSDAHRERWRKTHRERAERARRIRDTAVFMGMADDGEDGPALWVMVEPDQNIFVERWPTQDEDAGARPLVERLARALGYEVEDG